mmetsp:Transcript_18709/g.27729  ORF Transcript_18709/g.27729 Transcript_18709/m.27729 type:complete len:295 (-) Transcript_18709:28-912(-)
MERRLEIRQCVNFPEEQDELEQVIIDIPRRQDMTEEEISRAWFSKTDFVLFKRTAQMIAKSSQDFGMCSVLASCYEEESTSQENQYRLNQWSRHGTIRRGLEYWCSSELASRRSTNMRRLIGEVLRAQEETKANGDNNADPSLLASLSRTHSSASRTFARMLGIADAWAAGPLSVPATNSQARMLLLRQRHHPRPPTQQVAPVDESGTATTGDEVAAQHPRRQPRNSLLEGGQSTHETITPPDSEWDAQRVDSFQMECKSSEERQLHVTGGTLQPPRRRRSRAKKDKTYASTAA